MIEYLVVASAALLVAALTLFSGFGLGTLLMPVLAIFFPVPVAVAATAVVHLANNLFKLVLVGRGADWAVVVRFAIPAALAAIVGALSLEAFSSLPPLLSYELLGAEFQVTAVGLVIGLVIIAFALLDITPFAKGLRFERKYLPLGGAISGYFGGLSGNQGALRSAFMIRLGLSKEAFIGTTTVASVIVDLSRLMVYGLAFYSLQFQALPSELGGLIAVAIVFALIGSLIGSRLVKKVTLRSVQLLVGVMLLLVGASLALGLI